jgi:signal transduction histidine kinase
MTLLNDTKADIDDPRPDPEPEAEARPTSDTAGSTSVLAALSAMPVGILLEGDQGTCWMNDELQRIWQRRGPLDAAPGELQAALERPARVPRADAKPPVSPSRPRDNGKSWRRRLLRRRDASTIDVRVATSRLPLGRRAASTTATLVLEEDSHTPDAERREAFLAMIGHELGTPITSIVAGAELLRGDALDEASREEVASLVVEEANRTHLLVEQLTALALLQSQATSAAGEPVHLYHVAQRVAARSAARRAGLNVRLDPADTLTGPAVGDEGYVAQVVEILIDNAAKYAGTAAPVEIVLEATGGQVELHVLDRGPGLPEGDHDRLFELYERAAGDGAGGTPRGVPGPRGSGIGLYVARELVYAMGGRMWARQRAGGGADVGFALPAVA